MQNIALLIACLACAGQGCRVQENQVQSRPAAELQKPTTVADTDLSSIPLGATQSDGRVSARRNQLRALFELFLASNPPAAFTISSPRVRSKVGSASTVKLGAQTRLGHQAPREFTRPVDQEKPRDIVPPLNEEQLDRHRTYLARLFSSSGQEGGTLTMHPSDPYGEQEARERKNKENEFKVNLGEAIDSLNTDIPRILGEEPNWDIYTEDLELDLELVDPAATRVLGTATPASKTKVKGLSRNMRAWKQLQEFCKNSVEWNEVKVKTRMTYDSETGDQIIEARWNARMEMKKVQIAKWATVAAGAAALAAAVTSGGANPLASFVLADSDALATEFYAVATAATFVKFLQDRFPDISFPFATAAMKESDSNNILLVDAVSRFYLNSEGRIYRHVIDNVNLRFINDHMAYLSKVDRLLILAGLQKVYPRRLAEA